MRENFFQQAALLFAAAHAGHRDRDQRESRMTKFDDRQFTHVGELMAHFDGLPNDGARRSLLQIVAGRVEAAHAMVC